MNIKTQKTKKRLPNRHKAALIQIELIRRGLRQKDICVDLNVSPGTVYSVIYGLSKSARITKWIEDNLNLKLGEN